MRKTKPVKLTRFEMEIMNALWANGRLSIREVQEMYPEKKRPAYTTVQTIVYRLEAKGAVKRVKKIGNAHIFEAVVTPESAHRRIVDDLLHLFGGSARPLMAQLFDANKLTPDDLSFIKERLAESNQAKGSAKK